MFCCVSVNDEQHWVPPNTLRISMFILAYNINLFYSGPLCQADCVRKSAHLKMYSRSIEIKWLPGKN